MKTVREKLALLRAKMKEAGMSAYVVPMGDFHGSEYVSAHFRTVEYLSGFSGSAGTAVVAPGEACLWTDGRYFLQAEQELSGTEFRLMRIGVAGVPTVAEYLAEMLPEGGALGFDGRTVQLSAAEAWEKALSGKRVSFAFSRDLVGEIWPERPELSFKPVFALPETVTGESAAEKLARLRAEMKRLGADRHFLTSLDDIAWLLNIRGGDVPENPVVLSFLSVSAEEAVWYGRAEKLPEEIKAELRAAGVTLCPYEDFWQEAERVPAGSTLLLDKSRSVYALKAALPEGVKLLRETNPTTLMKCVKNEAEIAALRESHRCDGLAMVKWLYWLKHHPDPETLTETDAADKLEACRREQGAFELSFATIAAMGPNAAMMHYAPTAEKCSPLVRKGFLLVDSGGQYMDGTTDITRTIPMGPLTEEERRAYTAVLRSMLRLSSARFLQGVTCYFLDILARGPVWDMGLDYRCGTGHGVGFCLNVHEGPNRFSWVKPADASGLVELKPGMVTTDEPGIYVDGKYGIRIENELLCVKGEKNEYGQFLGFETLTLCPIDTGALIPEEMTQYELAALDRYHEEVYTRLKDGLSRDEAAWLREITRPVSR